MAADAASTMQESRKNETDELVWLLRLLRVVVQNCVQHGSLFFPHLPRGRKKLSGRA